MNVSVASHRHVEVESALVSHHAAVAEAAVIVKPIRSGLAQRNLRNFAARPYEAATRTIESSLKLHVRERLGDRRADDMNSRTNLPLKRAAAKSCCASSTKRVGCRARR